MASLLQFAGPHQANHTLTGDEALRDWLTEPELIDAVRLHGVTWEEFAPVLRYRSLVSMTVPSFGKPSGWLWPMASSHLPSLIVFQ